MAEHYPKGQTECEAYCAKCGRFTMHRVDHPPAGQKGGGRQGPCIDPAHPAPQMTQKEKKRAEQAEKDRRNPKLF
jgi:hypothetical protein